MDKKSGAKYPLECNGCAVVHLVGLASLGQQLFFILERHVHECKAKFTYAFEDLPYSIFKMVYGFKGASILKFTNPNPSCCPCQKTEFMRKISWKIYY